MPAQNPDATKMTKTRTLEGSEMRTPKQHDDTYFR